MLTHRILLSRSAPQLVYGRQEYATKTKKFAFPTPRRRPENMLDWSAQHVGQWLHDTCRVDKEVLTRIVAKTSEDPEVTPGTALARLGLRELRLLCRDAITEFAIPDHDLGRTYWHASRLFQEICLRREFKETYVKTADPYHWPYNGILHPGNTALIVIDMQKDFMEKGGYMNLVNPTWEPNTSIIGPTQKLLKAFRDFDYHIIHTREGHEGNMMDLPANKYWRTRADDSLPGIGDGYWMIGKDGSKTFSRILTRGYPGWDCIEECIPRPGETIIDKPTKGAFGNTEIEMYLHTRKIQNLVFSGVTTDVCVSTIMREANDRGFECILITDATASANEKVKEAIITSIHLSNGIFGCTATADELLRALPQSENTVAIEDEE